MSQLLYKILIASAIGVNESERETLSGGSLQLHLDYKLNDPCCAYFSFSCSMHKSIQTPEIILTVLHLLIKNSRKDLLVKHNTISQEYFSVRLAPLPRSISFTSAFNSQTPVSRNHAHPTIYGRTYMVRTLLPRAPATPMLRKCTKMAQTGGVYLTSLLLGHESRERHAS